MATMNISLPDNLKEWVDAEVAEGRYAGASDVMRDLIRDAQYRKALTARLNAQIQEGLDSGPATEFDFKTFRAEMRERMKLNGNG